MIGTNLTLTTTNVANIAPTTVGKQLFCLRLQGLLVTGRNEVLAKVIFSQACVILSTGGGSGYSSMPCKSVLGGVWSQGGSGPGGLVPGRSPIFGGVWSQGVSNFSGGLQFWVVSNFSGGLQFFRGSPIFPGEGGSNLGGGVEGG